MPFILDLDTAIIMHTFRVFDIVGTLASLTPRNHIISTYSNFNRTPKNNGRTKLLLPLCYVCVIKVGRMKLAQ